MTNEKLLLYTNKLALWAKSETLKRAKTFLSHRYLNSYIKNQ